jgi:hypothetical protein
MMMAIGFRIQSLWFLAPEGISIPNCFPSFCILGSEGSGCYYILISCTDENCFFGIILASTIIQLGQPYFYFYFLLFSFGLMRNRVFASFAINILPFSFQALHKIHPVHYSCLLINFIFCDQDRPCLGMIF